MIKDVLDEANRYEDVIDVLDYIIKNLDNTSYPVNAFIDEEGKTQWRVDGKSIKIEAAQLVQIINNKFPKFNNLLSYIESEADMMMHNYSVSISHRKNPIQDMEMIRKLQIISSLIYDYTDNGCSDWTIPSGWKKEKKYFIIGSLKQEDKIVKLSSEKYPDSKHVYSDPNKSFVELVKVAFDNIDKADTIVVVKKPDGSIGEGTTYELEYAKRIGKNIIFED